MAVVWRPGGGGEGRCRSQPAAAGNQTPGRRRWGEGAKGRRRGGWIDVEKERENETVREGEGGTECRAILNKPAPLWTPLE